MSQKNIVATAVFIAVIAGCGDKDALDTGDDTDFTWASVSCAVDAPTPHPDADARCAAGVAAFLEDGSTYTTIRAAISASGVGEAIYVCPGTYSETLTLKNRILAAASGSAADTILDGGGARRIMTASEQVALYSLTFQNGSDGYDGGAISGTGILFVSCAQFLSNSAGYEGGGISMRGDLSIVDSSFSGNSADYEGGAVMIRGNLSIVDSSFSDNRAGHEGGAVSFGTNDSHTLEIAGSTFLDNTSGVDGGGLHAGASGAGDDLRISSTRFEGNEAASLGGGISIGSSGAALLELTDAVLINNSAVSGAGLSLGSTADSYEVLISGTLFDGNVATDAGGAIVVGGRVVAARVTLQGSTITANKGTAVVTTSAVDLTSDGSDWGSESTDNAPSDLSSACGTYDTLGSAESFNCSPSGVWTP